MHIAYQNGQWMEVVRVEHPDVYLRYAIRLFGSSVQTLQLMWSDERRRLPWDPGWASSASIYWVKPRKRQLQPQARAIGFRSELAVDDAAKDATRGPMHRGLYPSGSRCNALPLRGGDGEQMPRTRHAFELVRPPVLELES